MKYCPECDMKNLEDAGFCMNCGTKLEVKIPTNNTPIQQATNESLRPQYYGQPQQYTPQKPSRKYKPIIAIVVVIGVVAILIGALLATGLLTGISDSGSDINKIHVSGGPKVNLQAIANGGNTLTQPAEDHTAVYGYYMSGRRFGTISFTTTGEEYYQGMTCEKIIGSGNFNIELYGQSMKMNFDVDAYTLKSDETLVYCNFDFSVVTPISFDMDATIDVDRDNNEITYTVSNDMIGTTSTVIEVSDDYWTYTDIEDNLYVGHSTEVSYTVSAYGYDVTVDMEISVITQEDVTVGKGTFEDCYKVQIEQDGTEIAYVWLDEDGVCPKIQLGAGATSTGIQEVFTIELEEYYTT